MSKDTYNEFFTDISQYGKFFQLTFYTNEKDKFLAMQDLARKCIDNAPIDDVVAVVRCKDCKHYGGATYGFVCRKFSGIDTKICMDEYDYCSYGERRANDGT